jgi:hypothetical protein
MIDQQTRTQRINLLKSIAKKYVEDGLGGKNFEIIPYHDQITLRAPINAGGSYEAIKGKQNLKENWWKPLPDLISKVNLIDIYVNDDLNAVVVEFHCEIKSPHCWLRITDRFKVDDDGLIIDQENFFDPRTLTDSQT